MSDALTVGELVATTLLGRAELRAGREGLDRPVVRVQCMEVLDDVGPYLGRGDCLLTTGYSLPGVGASGYGLIEQLDDCGVSAVVFKCRHYLPSVPREILRAGNRSGLPVFELEAELPFADLTDSILGELRPTAGTLINSSAVQRQLLRAIADGFDLGGLLRRAAALVGCVLAVRGTGATPDPGFAPNGASLDDERIAALDSGPEIRVDGVRWGELAVDAADLEPSDRRLLELVGSILALHVHVFERRGAVRAETRQLLLRDLARGSGEATEELMARAARLGIELPRQPLVVRARPRAGRGSECAPAELLARIERRLPGGGLLALADDGEVCALMSAQRRACLDDLDELAAWDVGLAIGESIAQVDRAYAHAGRALALGRALGRDGPTSYGSVELYDMALAGLGSEGWRRLHRRTLGRLEEGDRRAVELYCDHGHNASKAASALHMHRNTLYYRLRRVRQTVGLDLRRAEDRALCGLVILAESVYGHAGPDDGTSAAREDIADVPR